MNNKLDNLDFHCVLVVYQVYIDPLSSLIDDTIHTLDEIFGSNFLSYFIKWIARGLDIVLVELIK